MRREIARQTPTPAHVKIANLQVGMKKVNVIAEVLETRQPSKVHTQFRDNAVVSNAVIGDETGKILLCLWDQQVDAVSVGNPSKLRTPTSPCSKAKGNYASEKTAKYKNGKTHYQNLLRKTFCFRQDGLMTMLFGSSSKSADIFPVRCTLGPEDDV